MRALFLTGIIFSCLNSFGFSLESGDLLLISNDCFLCNMIETETHSPYSHIGIAVHDQQQWTVLEAYSKVSQTPLKDYLARRKPNSKVLVARYKNNSPKPSTSLLLQDFKSNFEGKSYDSEFLWNNHDSHGEKLYCSEFVAKFLSNYFSKMVPTVPMSFEINREFWNKFFHGNPPDGLPGLSPGDFERSPLFQHVGYL